MTAGKISINMDSLCGCISNLKSLEAELNSFSLTKWKTSKAGTGSLIDQLHSFESSTQEYEIRIKVLIQMTIKYLEQVKKFEELDGNLATPRKIEFSSNTKRFDGISQKEKK